MQKSFMVNIMDEIPCNHAISVIKHRNLNCYVYCSKFYKIETLLETYSWIVYLVGYQNTWKILEEIKSIKVKKSLGRRKAGRPEKRRAQRSWETTYKQKCSRCQEYGHNWKTCRNLRVRREQDSSSTWKSSKHFYGGYTIDFVLSDVHWWSHSYSYGSFFLQEYQQPIRALFLRLVY